MKLLNIFRRLICYCAALILLITGTCIYRYYSTEVKGEEYYAGMNKYKPSEQTTTISEDALTQSISDMQITPSVVLNTGIIELKDINPDVSGWITVDGTNIDYPFVKSSDNTDYLHTDIHKKYLFSGTVFTDFRCEPDLTGFMTVFYGHNMKNGSMFANLLRFEDETFWNNNYSGQIDLPYSSYKLLVFAYMVVSAGDDVIYNPAAVKTPEEINSFYDYVKDNAVHFREVGLGKYDKVVVLSTCSYQFTEARTVVIAKLIPV